MAVRTKSNSEDGNRKYKAQKHSPRQEKEWAKKLGGTTTPRSGAGKIKGDVRVKGVMRLENKCTSNKSFSVTYEMCQKIEDAALLNNGEVPSIQVDFLDESGKVKYQVAVVPVYVLEMLVNYHAEKTD